MREVTLGYNRIFYRRHCLILPFIYMLCYIYQGLGLVTQWIFTLMTDLDTPEPELMRFKDAISSHRLNMTLQIHVSYTYFLLAEF